MQSPRCVSFHMDVVYRDNQCCIVPNFTLEILCLQFSAANLSFQRTTVPAVPFLLNPGSHRLGSWCSFSSLNCTGTRFCIIILIVAVLFIRSLCEFYYLFSPVIDPDDMTICCTYFMITAAKYIHSFEIGLFNLDVNPVQSFN